MLLEAPINDCRKRETSVIFGVLGKPLLIVRYFRVFGRTLLNVNHTSYEIREKHVPFLIVLKTV
jgi:hypothetical protein